MKGVRLTVVGKPIPKQRPRIVRGRAFTPRESVEYESRIAWEAKESKVQFMPKQKLRVVMDFYLAPRSYALMDVDNLVKSCLDGLQKGGMFNDRDVDAIYGAKHKSDPDQERTIIVVKTLTTDRAAK